MTTAQTDHTPATVAPTGSALALASDQEWWSDKQLAGLRQLGVDKASNGDLAVFLHVTQRTGLDPFAKQIYMIERQGKQTIQTGIDGFRLVARRAVDRTGETLAIGASEWCGEDGLWTDVWVSDQPPAAARVVVRRDGHEFPGVALFREYAQRTRDGRLMAMWAQRPAGQLAKCAEALALRKGFPQDLSGVYTDDEMASAENPRRRRGPASPGLAQTLAPEPNADPETGEIVDGEVVDASTREVAAIPHPTRQTNVASATRRTRRARRRRTYQSDIADRVSGVLAWFDGTCPRCDDLIVSRQSQVVRRGEDWIHATCAPGGDDL